MRKALYGIFTLTKRNLKEILRDPLSLVFLMVLPLFMEILFYFIFHKLTPQFEMKYLAPGIVVFSQSFLTLFAGMLIALDRSTSFLTRLYVSKTKSYQFILGYALALVPIAFVQAVLFFMVGAIIDHSILSVGMLWSILSSILTSVLFIGLGILLGSLCNEKAIGGVSSIVIAGQSVLSGMWFPQEGLGKGILTAMRCFPFKNATDIAQNVLNGINNFMSDFGIPFLIVMAYILVSFVLAVIVFHNKMKAK